MFPERQYSLKDLLIVLLIIFLLFGVFGLGLYVENKDHIKRVGQTERSFQESEQRTNPILTQNDGRLQSTQRGNVAYFYQLNATNDNRIPLRDHGAMLVAFESTAKLIGPVVSVSSEIIPYNGRLAYMGMWVTFMPRTLPESLPR